MHGYRVRCRFLFPGEPYEGLNMRVLKKDELAIVAGGIILNKGGLGGRGGNGGAGGLVINASSGGLGARAAGGDGNAQVFFTNSGLGSSTNFGGGTGGVGGVGGASS
jgi:hypothetical protein